jgi:N-acetyl-anhydromuramyl-L-alanine amidase AmpD
MGEQNHKADQEKSTGVQVVGRRQARMRRRRRQRLVRFSVLCVVSCLLLGSLRWLWLRFHPAHPGTETALVRTSVPHYADPPGIVLHSSNTPGSVHGVPIDAARLEEIHATDHPQWATEFEGKVYHIGYHYVILPDGKIEKGRPDHCPGCHAPHFNHWLGICLVGCFDPSMPHRWKPARPTRAQVASLLALCERLMLQYHIPAERVIRHSDTKPTWCPGRRFPYRAIARQLRTFASLHPELRSIVVPD